MRGFEHEEENYARDEWGLTKYEFERLMDAIDEGVIPKSEVQESRGDLKNGLLTVDELIGIWSNNDDDEDE